jgi:membrane protease YdiL (CAAX protease family)
LTATRSRVSWQAVALFYGLACALSWPFLWWQDMHPASWAGLPIPDLLKPSTYMWGPGLAALVVLMLYRRSHRRTISFFGTSAARSVAFYLVPALALPLAYLPVAGPSAVATLGLVAAAGFFNALGEELGWRGFLQDALRPLPPLWRYAAIGALWEFWHFTKRFHGGDPADIVISLAIAYPLLMALSALIGEAADRSRSLCVAVTLHFWMDAPMGVPALMGGSALPTILVFAGALLFWVVLLGTWPRRVSSVSHL